MFVSESLNDLRVINTIMKQPCVYILTNKPQGSLSIGVTSNLPQRIWQHKNKLVDGFTKKYNTTQLVHYEVCEDMHQAITREKQLKRWHRQWKINLIEENNQTWTDLSVELIGCD